MPIFGQDSKQRKQAWGPDVKCGANDFSSSKSDAQRPSIPLQLDLTPSYRNSYAAALLFFDFVF